MSSLFDSVKGGPTRAWKITTLRKLLRVSKQEITFTKKDGTVRKLTGTLDYTYIPITAWPQNKIAEAGITNGNFGKDSPVFAEEPVSESQETIKVYEMGNGWRSINLSSISEVRWVP